MNIELPRPVAAYLTAEAAKDSAALARCFDEAAIVRDEGREHRGRPAIEAWHRDANEKLPYVVDALEASARGPTVVVRTRVTGAFASSPAELWMHFTLDGDRITSLEVTP